ncbi:GNAT family N-acetyltransferase [Neobacillus niacini]|uniref:GNAT family N-acetyltransferase n=1 Tax=Neobacillus niacini TaxID=86668 RepID=UPI00300035CA
MRHVEIRRPRFEEIEDLHEFFRIVITDTFIREGLEELVNDIETEIESKINFLKSDFDSNGEKRFFLIALEEEKIIGTIEYGPSSELINVCTDGELRNLVEVGTVFIHPDFQRQGVGNRLLYEMVQTLHNLEIAEYCLDSGYGNAQKVWKKKFGEPNYLLKDYWGNGQDHMIWKISIK